MRLVGPAQPSGGAYHTARNGFPLTHSKKPVIASRSACRAAWRSPQARGDRRVAAPSSDARCENAGVSGDLHVVLVHPEIHWNTGNAGRTCLAAGARLHLVRPLGFSLDDREVARAGLDYWERVRPVVWQSWADLELRLPELGEPFLFTAEAERTLWDVTFPACPVLVFGRESVGLPPEVRAHHADRLVRIPMLDPDLRSLNLSTSVAIAAYEVLRQRRTP
jgi:tRNA (cytidine/uridine-2'-O-)-methyltransferase